MNAIEPNAIEPNAGTSEQKTLVALRVVKDCAERAKGAADSLTSDKTFDVLTDEAIDSAFAAELTKEESAALLKALRAINGAVVAVKEAFLREAKEAEKATLARRRACASSFFCAAIAGVALYFHESEAAIFALSCSLAIAAPELRDFLFPRVPKE